MSSFFTLPASQRKRKRTQAPLKSSTGTTKRNESRDNESISGSDISDDDVPAEALDHSGSEDEDEEIEGEDPAAKRIRLAEQYLSNTEKEVLDEAGFDAAEVDQENLRRRMGERLKEDTAESKGKLYRWIADGLDWRSATTKVLRCHSLQKSFTGVAVQGRHVYGVSKDMHIVKWELPDGGANTSNTRISKKPKVVARTRGNRKQKNAQHHYGAILCIAASQDGKFVATGGADKKLIIWDALTLKPLKVFMQHRDAVIALAFRRGMNQLFSASKDRTIKIWSLNELSYIETLFGHQDEVVDVAALGQEKCVTVGARDRTARLWKVVEESQLVFRGGGAHGTFKATESLRRAYEEDSTVNTREDRAYNEGSIDRITMIDDDTFITASDNGSLSLWNIHKKKAVYTLPLAHGVDKPLPLDQASAELNPDETLDERGRGGKQPRWITALKAIPFSDVFVSGSWDGYVRVWKISKDRRRIDPLGAVGALGESVETLLENEGLSSDSMSKDALDAMKHGADNQKRIQGIINDLAISDVGEKSAATVLIAAAVGKEHRLGRWKEALDGRNQVIIFQVSRAVSHESTDEQSELERNGEAENDITFEGFD